MINKAKNETNYNNVSRVIKVVKQIFNAPSEDIVDEDKAKGGKEAPKEKRDSLTSALNTKEYKVIFDFFVVEVADLVLKVAEIDEKLFDKFEAKYAKEHCYLDLKAVYKHLSTKQSMLLKTFSANFNKLLKKMVTKQGKNDSAVFQSFFAKGKSIVKCCLPFRIYSRKLANITAQLCMQYGQID